MSKPPNSDVLKNFPFYWMSTAQAHFLKGKVHFSLTENDSLRKVTNTTTIAAEITTTTTKITTTTTTDSNNNENNIKNNNNHNNHNNSNYN